MEYVKTDLVAPKGVAYFKFSKASAALAAMEDVCGKGMVREFFCFCCCVWLGSYGGGVRACQRIILCSIHLPKHQQPHNHNQNNQNS